MSLNSALNVVTSTESLESIQNFFNSFKNSTVVKTVQVMNLLQNDADARVEFKPRSIKSISEKAEEVGSIGLADITLIKPAGLVEFLTPYANFIYSNVEEFRTIEKRLYTPFISIIHDIISKEMNDATNIGRSLKFIEHDLTRDVLRSYISDKSTERDNTVTSFSQLYRNTKDFHESLKLISELSKLQRKVNLKSIIETEETLAEALDDVVKAIEDGILLPNSKAVNEIRHLTKKIAEETELLALLFSQSQRLIAAQDNNLVKLLEVL